MLLMQDKLRTFENWVNGHHVERPSGLHVAEIQPGFLGVVFDGDIASLKSFSEIQNFELNHQRDPIHPSKKIKVEK
jgi:hypothetical protein